MNVGFRVYTERLLPAKDVIDGFKSLPAANVADCMNRLCALRSDIRLMGPRFEGSMVGVALTVKVRPGDNLMLHKALNLATEGDVMIVANEGDRSQSLMGEIMFTYGKFKKMAGFVFDGPVRDVDALQELGIPVYASGSTPGGPFKQGPGEINVPIACGNVQVSPGDIVLGDSDGVIVIPRQGAAVILEKARKFSANDQSKVAAAANGTLDRSWVDKSLAELGCDIIEGRYE